MCFFGIFFAVNHIPHNRTIMSMRYAAEMGIFFFQLYDGCMDRHGAFYVSHNPGRNQKQADTEQYQTDSEKEYVIHSVTL